MNQKENLRFGDVNILIFEEYLFVSDILSKMLNSFGIRKIHKAKTLLEARSICESLSRLGQSEKIDFAVVDLVPPNCHGIEFLKWLRHHSQYSMQYMPVIFTTNDSRKNVVLNCRDSGANEILVKPYTAYNVSNHLISIINKPRAFVKCSNYTGPSRRRRVVDYDGGDRRVITEDDVEVVYEKDVA